MTQRDRASRIWQILNDKNNLAKSLGLEHALSVEKDLLICVIGNPGCFLEEIIRHEYFRNFGRSTIKRGIASLLKSDLIEFKTDEKDKRKNLIYFKEKK